MHLCVHLHTDGVWKSARASGFLPEDCDVNVSMPTCVSTVLTVSRRDSCTYVCGIPPQKV